MIYPSYNTSEPLTQKDILIILTFCKTNAYCEKIHPSALWNLFVFKEVSFSLCEFPIPDSYLHEILNTIPINSLYLRNNMIVMKNEQVLNAKDQTISLSIA